MINTNQFDTLRNLLKDVIKEQHFKEVRCSELSDEAIAIGYKQASYGDWTYYIEKDGSLVCTYFSIGD